MGPAIMSPCLDLEQSSITRYVVIDTLGDMSGSVHRASERMRLATTITRGFVEGAALDARHALMTRRSGRPVDVPYTDTDPLAAEVLNNPDRWFRQLHEAGPVNYCPRRNIWIINGFNEARAAARDHTSLSSAQGTARFRTRLPMMLTMDRPEHARLRRILARDFTKERMGEYETRIRTLTEQRVDPLLGRSEPADAHDALAGPVPVEMIGHILGIEPSRRSSIHAWSASATAAFAAEVNLASAKTMSTFLIRLTEMFEYFGGVIEERRRRPGEDAISRLIAFEDDEGALTTNELLWFILVLLVAGNETTTAVMMALLFCLGEHPDQLAQLRADPDRIPSAVEEAVRWASPVPAFFRTATTAYDIDGVTIPPDARVMLNFAAANRDPRVFAAPDRFDVMRPAHDHVGFGSGIHFCLGSHLARLELRILLEILVDRVERIEIAGQPVWRRNPSLRGLEAMPVRFV